MSLDSKYLFKWLEANQSWLSSLSFCVSRMGMVVSYDKDHCARALSVFEPRDFNEAFVLRLQNRLQKEAALGRRLKLFLPAYLKHRATTLFAKNSAALVEISYTSFLKVENKAGIFSVRDRLRILNVDDSPVILKLLAHITSELGYVDVLAQISDPLKAVDAIRLHKPDVVSMDIQMPRKTGVEVVKDLLAQSHFPVVIVSSLNMEEGSLVLKALEAGAFDYLQKPAAADKAQFSQDFEEKILLAAENSQKKVLRPRAPSPIVRHSASAADLSDPDLLWCIGASTGGTQALTRVFTSLPHEIPPTLVVQHIPPVFSRAFAESLDQLCPFRVKEAEPGEAIEKNCVYIAPGGLQMGVELKNRKLHIRIEDSAPVNRFKPSVDYLFSDVAKKLTSHRIVAGILTGMGKDGAAGQLLLKKGGAATFAQDEESSAVFGMPRAAIEMGAADVVCPLDAVANTLLSLSQKKSRKAS